MGNIYKKDGRLNFPIFEELHLPQGKVDEKEGRIILHEAYCPQGHNLISSIKIDDYNGIQFIYTDQDQKREAEVIISPFVGACTKVILKGEHFRDGEIVKIFCPQCRTELPTLSICECEAPIYLFFLDSTLKSTYGQSFCSRIGCSKSSRLRFSRDVVDEFMQKYCF